ncbi:MAG: tRNA (guanosine(46)-N7)-methyltransferase TrmB [Firmicutes bacterium]|nr:tRNA (guanosine(46)-N7)-methyltransferase TrmB [Bacillota bacterium]
MRTRKKPWTEAELAANSRVVREPFSHKGGWKEFFGNQNPVRLEIGCGKGRFIAKMAAMNPEINFVALERDRTILAAAARNGKEAQNLAFIIGDAESLPELFGEREVDKIYLQFCDPWPNRKKWAKRRLTHVRFLDIYRRILADGGGIFFKTDNRQLMEFSITQFSAGGWLITDVSLDARAAGRPEGDAMPATEYEEKFAALGMPIYRLEAVAIERRSEKAQE